MSMFAKTSPWAQLLGALAIAGALAAATHGELRAQTLRPTVTLEVGAGEYAGELEVPVNKSQILRVDRVISDLMVGNPDIADVLAVTNRTVYVLGKALGSTTLSIYGGNKSLIAVVDLVVTHDTEGLKRRLAELMPQERIEVRSVNDSLVLSGTVSGAEKAQTAVSIAERFAPAAVTNLLRVDNSQQVMLAVRFAEVKRTVKEQLGLNNDILVDAGDATFRLVTGLGVSTDAFGAVAASAVTGDWTIESMLDALEQRGAVRILAEPNLIALSGETATFLAGGEFPIPVAQSLTGDDAAITVEFKEFGVSLAFTPTVVGDDIISLVVAPEVSAIDPTTSVQLTGFSIPGLTTRRARTTVDLRDGQSFAIAGLIQSDFRDRVSQLPFIGSVPVLGALFRSAEYQRDETELVIIITPYLVKPARPRDLKLPSDSFVPPTRSELFLEGKIEGFGLSAASARSLRAALPSAGGLDGEIGHIIYGGDAP